jgi:hypothetical protein
MKTCTECGEKYAATYKLGGLCPECASWEQCPECNNWFAELTETADDGPVCLDCLNNNYIECPVCGDYVAKDTATETPDGMVCEECFDNHYTHCEHCGEIISVNESEEAPDTDVYCALCFERYCCTCDCCGETCWRNDMSEAPNGDWYCENCFEEHCTYCCNCDCLVWQDDTYDDGYCEDCHNSDEDAGDFDSVYFRGRDSYTRIGKRRYGVEIETQQCKDYPTLAGAIPFDIKYDGSISGKEFASTILYGDAGLEAIENLCEFAKNHGWTVDARCGLHIHLDVSSEKTKELKAIALAYCLSYEFWLSLVHPDRASNMYCEPNRTDLPSIKAIKRFSDFARKQCRYEYVNFAAYTKHKTFEVRLHHGSIDAKEICNWLRIHSVFMDWAASMSFTKVKNRLLGKTKEELHDYIMQICKDAGYDDLVEYYNCKVGRVCTDYVTVAI